MFGYEATADEQQQVVENLKDTTEKMGEMTKVMSDIASNPTVQELEKALLNPMNYANVFSAGLSLGMIGMSLFASKPPEPLTEKKFMRRWESCIREIQQVKDKVDAAAKQISNAIKESDFMTGVYDPVGRGLLFY